MVTTAVTIKKQELCYSESMDLRVFSAANLKRLRLAHKPPMSQKDLAEASGVSVSMIAKLEQDITSPTAEVLEKLGRALGVFFVIAWGEIEGDDAALFRDP